MASWKGQDLERGAPSLGFTLDSALLIPGFIEQSLGLPGLFAHADDTRLTPLDDLKDWMRSDPWRSGDLFGEVAAALLKDEEGARRAAEKSGRAFDRVDYELEQMRADESYESFDPAWAARIFALAVEEAEALQAWSRREHACDFALAASFRLPDPRKHRRLSREAIAAALAEHGNPEAAQALAAGRDARLELEGAFQLDLCAPAGGPDLGRRNGVGFVRVPCADPRAADQVDARLALAYPLAAEGYFLLSFEALRRDLALGPGAEGA